MANNFKLTLDTIAPVGTVTRPNQYVKDSVTVSITHNKKDGTNGLATDDDAVQMYVWYDKVQNTSMPSNPAWEAVASSKTISFSEESNEYYIHAIFRDAVGNVSSAIATTGVINYDKTAPSIYGAGDSAKYGIILADKDSGSTTISNEKEVTVTIYAKDNGATASGVKSITFTGDTSTPGPHALTNGVAQSTGDYAGYTKYTINITLKGPDGNKSITGIVSDNSGNPSAAEVSNTIKLDETGANAELILLKPDGSAKLAEFVNNREFKLSFKTEDADIVKYSFYGDCTLSGHDTKDNAKKSTSWTACSTASASAGSPVTITYPDKLTLTTGDGNKAIYLLVQDSAGTISEYKAGDANLEKLKDTTYLDLTGPVPTLSIKSAGFKDPVTEKYYVSDIAGFTNVTFTAGCNESGSGHNSHIIRNTTKAYNLKSSASDLGDATITASSTNFTANVFNSIVLTVTDKAGNTATTDAVEVYYDTAVPTISFTAPSNSWYTNATAVKIQGTITDPGAGVKEYYLWANNSATNNFESIKSSLTKVTPTDTRSISLDTALANIYSTGLNQSDTCYIHIYVVDNVGHTTHSTRAFKYDTTAPTIDTLASNKTAYKKDAGASNNYSETITLSFTFTETLSGVNRYQIVSSPAGVINTDVQTLTAGSNSVTTYINNTTGGNYKLTLYLYDTAGNKSAGKEITVEYDPTVPTGTISFVDASNTSLKIDGSTVYDNHSQFKIKITYDDDALNGVSYQVYGDISSTSGGTAIAYNANSWTKWTSSGATGSLILDSYYLTGNSSDGCETKTVTLLVKDNAGNISTAYSTSIQYDPTDPVVEITDFYGGFKRIGCVHNLRPNTTVTSDDKYGDTIVFKFNSKSDDCVEYKVCAYSTLAAAKAGTHADTAIGTTYGSSHTSGALTANANGVYTHTSAFKDIVVKINGKDYRAALGGSDTKSVDGIHYIVVYIKNCANKWSSVKQPTLISQAGKPVAYDFTDMKYTGDIAE